MDDVIKHEISALDFLRGWAAIFVFFHHAAILGGGPIILSGEIGQEAVNAFMLASGFLIFYQCSISNSYSQLNNFKGIKNFYIRRFFRISPLYYFILIFALFFSVYLGECREIILDELSKPHSNMDRYYINNPIKSYLIHITYIFGLHPYYSFSTPLPDWSLGLEMQFYILFPILYLLYKRHFLAALLITLSLMGCIKIALDILDVNFRMPSFLPIKFHNFSAGIALAYLYLNKKNSDKKHYFIIALTVITLIIFNKNLYIALIFTLFWLYLCKEKPGFIALRTKIRHLFEHKSSKFLADISYSVYLIHLLIMLPFFSYFVEVTNNSLSLWLILSLLLLSIVLIISLITYRYIEVPGTKIGKYLISKN